MSRLRFVSMALAACLLVGSGAAYAAPPTKKPKPSPTPTATTASPTPTAAGVMPAKSAKDFEAAVCINTHWNFLDTPYNGSYAALKNALIDLHITCARAAWSPGESWHTNRLKDLAASGIKHSMIIDDELFNDSADDRAAADADANGAVSVAEALDYLMDVAPETVLQLEGPNEELFDSGQCATTLTNTQQVWTAKQADSRYDGIWFVGPSAAWPTQYACLGDISGITDAGNIHHYSGDLTPEASENSSADWRLSGWMSNVRAAVGSDAPVVSTESGYHTAVNDPGGHRPVSETADGKYMTQLHFAFQRAGLSRTFKYELVDEFPNAAKDDLQSNFGLLRNDLTKKPAYTALNNVMDLLADSSQPSLTRLDYAVTGAPATVKSYLLQKSDGSHWLAVWNDIPVWDGATESDLTPADVTVALSFPSAKSLVIYRPYLSASAQESVSAATKQLSVNADPLLIKIT